MPPMPPAISACTGLLPTQYAEPNASINNIDKVVSAAANTMPPFMVSNVQHTPVIHWNSTINRETISVANSRPPCQPSLPSPGSWQPFAPSNMTVADLDTTWPSEISASSSRGPLDWCEQSLIVEDRLLICSDSDSNLEESTMASAANVDHTISSDERTAITGLLLLQTQGVEPKPSISVSDDEWQTLAATRILHNMAMGNQLGNNGNKRARSSSTSSVAANTVTDKSNSNQKGKKRCTTKKAYCHVS